MTEPANTVCTPWVTIAEMDVCAPAAVIAASGGVKQDAIDAASDLLWRWSGYRFPGVCEATVRPCAQNANLPQERYGRFGAYGWGYAGWWNWFPGWGNCGCQSNVHRACGCSYLPEIQLGRAPIVAVTQVKLNGSVLVNSSYRVDDYEWLVRIDGDSWPCCQDLTQPDTADNTFSVSFTWGRTPPPSGKAAAIDLAIEYVKNCPTGDCAPPATASSITRQGTSVQLIAPERFGRDSFDNLRYGIKSVDRFLAAVPTHRPALIVSPDIDAGTRRVGT